jgi:hypothetical protein
VQGLTPDISKLVNLRVLTIRSLDVLAIPESISCLQKLEHLNLNGDRVQKDLPAGFPTLANLTSLRFASGCGVQLNFPPDLRVSACSSAAHCTFITIVNMIVNSSYMTITVLIIIVMVLILIIVIVTIIVILTTCLESGD